MASVTTEDVLIIMFSILLPPIAVILMKRPLADVLINIILTLFFWIGGVIHALYLLYQRRRSWW
ncbi:plasma membrane proteolipid 3 [Desarmillaria tabescens]|uniref:Plasma membrane proteolipid 3 n=1 Tax=Armillaria tabescens TaxID=1929756 RepID=A0AA39T404_ARMTA|nr:plasma membrane proteolipid 3 [Desarmillaria tabescens]KAK0463001.1 plasma membrane proteolipid 3 [Desarmillaria tabescens]